MQDSRWKIELLAILVVSLMLQPGCGGSVSVNPPQVIVKQHSVSLNWTLSSSTSVIGYNIYRGTQPGGPYSKVNASLQTGTSYADSDVVAGRTYFYVVTAISGNNLESDYSKEVQASVPTD